MGLEGNCVSWERRKQRLLWLMERKKSILPLVPFFVPWSVSFSLIHCPALTIVLVWPPTAFSFIYQYDSHVPNDSRDIKKYNLNRKDGQSFLLFFGICVVLNYFFLLTILGGSECEGSYIWLQMKSEKAGIFYLQKWIFKKWIFWRIH